MEDNNKKNFYNDYWMDEYYNRMLNCTSTTGRKNNYDKMLEIYKKSEFIRERWTFTPMGNYVNRFTKKKITKRQNKVITHTCGLYMVGSVYLNPYTKEEYYWIKVGQSKDIESRILDYKTHNPMIWLNDTCEIGIEFLDKMEKLCHRQLKAVSTEVAENTKEWFLVSRETYLAICEKSWDWFYAIDEYKFHLKSNMKMAKVG